MDDRPRRRLAAIAVLALACIALIATSPGAPTLRADASGELAVSPERPGEVQVRFAVADPAPTNITRLQVFAVVYGDSDPRLSARASAVVTGSQNQVAGVGYLTLDHAACARGCEVITNVVASWSGQPGSGVRTRWEAEIEVQYESGPPQSSAVTATVVGGGPSIPRVTWMLFGVVLAVAAAVFLVATGDRFGRARLFLAAGLFLPPAIGLGLFVEQTSSVPPGVTLMVDVTTYAMLAAAVALILGASVGVWRAWHGRDAMLRVVGWLGALGIGLSWWFAVDHMGVYRPSEVTLLTFAFLLPSAVAIGGAPRLEAVTERRVGPILALVIAAQLLMAAASVFAAGAVVFAFVASLLAPVPRLPDIGSFAYALVPILIAGGMVVGLWSWRRGYRGTLIAANVPVVLVVLAGAAWSLLAGEGGLLVPSPEIRLIAVVAGALALVGIVGVLVVTPTWAGAGTGVDTGPRRPDASADVEAAPSGG